MNPKEHTAYSLQLALLATRDQSLGIALENVAQIMKEVYDKAELQSLSESMLKVDDLPF